MSLYYQQKFHRKRRRPWGCEPLSPSQSRLLLFFLFLKLLAVEVTSSIDRGSSCYDILRRNSNRLSRLACFGSHRPMAHRDPRLHHDRSESFKTLYTAPYHGRLRSHFSPLLFLSNDGGRDDELNGIDGIESTVATQPLELMQTIIFQQQRQIESLLQLLQLQQQRPSALNTDFSVNGDSFVTSQSPLLFQPLPSLTVQNSTDHQANQFKSFSNVKDSDERNWASRKVLKAMLFIDGTWLYYSIHERLAKDCSIIQKYGRGWQHRYDIDWAKLPSLLCQTMQRELMEQMNVNTGSDSPEIQINLVRSSVYTSYKADTPTTSYRYKLFQELQKANYHVHMMETVGKSEKCVDIQLAVEILHYATMDNPSNSYDIALLLTGDKDLMPAIIRTRCKGKRVGLVSMRPGCNRALVDTPGLLDFDVFWMEDFLDQLIIPRIFLDGEMMDTSQVADGGNELRLVSNSMYVLHKVVHDFVRFSGLPQVSSRDLGRYLKQLSLDGMGRVTLLDTMKRYYGGMHQYLSSMGCYDCALPSFSHSTTDHSYWISLIKTQLNGVDDFRFDEPFSEARLTEAETQFFSSYSVERLVSDRQTLYQHSIQRMLNLAPGERDLISDVRNSNDNLSSMQRVFDEISSFDECDNDLESPSLHSDYDGMTLVELKEVCRKKGLAVSGKKAALLSRIEDYLKNQQPAKDPPSLSKELSKETVSQPSHVNDDPVAAYLKELMLEYLHAKGGVANSRMIGRYLAANKASPRSQLSMNNALKEMKSKYGNLNSFVAAYPGTFIALRDSRSNNSVDGGTSGSVDFGFNIALSKQQKDRT